MHVHYEGRSFAVGPRRVLVLVDDPERQFPAIAMAEFYKNELPGWDKKATKIMSMMGL